MHQEMTYIALGSNLGESAVIIRTAMDKLEILLDAELQRSSLWRSTPVDCPAGSADFINAVVGCQMPAEWSPADLLHKLQQLEQECGRPAGRGLNAPRTLDLDIIYCAGLVVNTPELTIPHPRAQQRAFVMLPLHEIAPRLIFPDTGSLLSDIIEQLSVAGVDRIIQD